jgi:hypothetical protein
MSKSVSFIAIAAAMLVSSPAFSAPVLSSSANAASVNLNVGNVVAANVALAPVSGTAAPDYNNSATLASINQSTHLFGSILSVNAGVNTGIVTTSAQSSYPGSATGTANIVNARAGIYTSLLGAIPLAALGLSADAITSTTVAGINGGGLFASGSSSIANLVLAGSIFDGLGLNLGVFSNPLPNTVGLSVLGLNIKFNEQLLSQTTDSIFMTTNAVHITLDDYLFNGRLLSGNVILGHSQASVTGYVPAAVAVPEPATWALMIGGFGLVGFSLRTRTRARPVLA